MKTLQLKLSGSPEKLSRVVTHLIEDEVTILELTFGGKEKKRSPTSSIPTQQRHKDERIVWRDNSYPSRKVFDVKKTAKNLGITIKELQENSFKRGTLEAALKASLAHQ